MAASFFFYDLETSGRNPREDRIMQFAGQRTDMDLKPIGEPYNILIKLTPDILPEPEAVLLTGITPQQSIAEGISEAAFLKIFEAEISKPDTIFVGFNSIRFDDEFIRCTRYRNYYDPYEWTWKDGRSRWDLLDVVRMTRALRPEGIEWPVDEEGRPTNRLELITKLNGLDHQHAHDALNDVMATIAVAKLIRDKQPKLFDYLMNCRGKKEVEKLVTAGEPFVYTSGKYAAEHQKTTVAYALAPDIGKQGMLVYDLHYDPEEFIDLSPEQLVELWQWTDDKAAKRLPVKILKFNRCPAVATVNVLDEASQQRIQLDKATWEKHLAKLKAAKDFPNKLQAAQRLMEEQRAEQGKGSKPHVDSRIYDGFLDEHDANRLVQLRRAEPAELAAMRDGFHDERLKDLLPLYKARNYPATLDDDERQEWEEYCRHRLFDGEADSRLAKYFAQLAQCAENPKYKDKQFLLEELQLYGQSLMPVAA